MRPVVRTACAALRAIVSVWCGKFVVGSVRCRGGLRGWELTPLGEDGFSDLVSGLACAAMGHTHGVWICRSKIVKTFAMDVLSRRNIQVVRGNLWYTLV